MQYYDQLWQAIIRPPRANYTLEALGPDMFVFDNGVKVLRTDVEIVN